MPDGQDDGQDDGISEYPGRRGRPEQRAVARTTLVLLGLTIALMIALTLAVLAGPAGTARAAVPVPAAVPGRAAVPVRAAVAGRPRSGALSRPVALPQVWVWPLLPAPRVLRAFDNPAKPWLPGHRGVDLAALPGQPVLAAAAGIVVFAGPLAGRGVVSIEHGGIRSSYEPVVPLVKPGDPVVVGQPVAVVAPAPLHCRAHICLHWGAFESLSVPRRYLDPRLLVHAGPVRLVPTGTVLRAGAPADHRGPSVSETANAASAGWAPAALNSTRSPASGPPLGADALLRPDHAISPGQAVRRGRAAEPRPARARDAERLVTAALPPNPARSPTAGPPLAMAPRHRSPDATAAPSPPVTAMSVAEPPGSVAPERARAGRVAGAARVAGASLAGIGGVLAAGRHLHRRRGRRRRGR